MTKRKSDNDASSRSKRVRLDGHEGPASRTLSPHKTDSTPLSLATPQRLGKRKRQDPGTEPVEEPRTKRVRRSSDASGRDSGETSPVELWPGIGYEPGKEEEPDFIWRIIAESHRQAMLFDERQRRLRDRQPLTEEHNPLPSPTPSIRDSGESDAEERLTMDLIIAQDSGSESDEPQDASLLAISSKKTNQLPRNRLRKRNATPRQRKQQQPRKKAKYKGQARHQSSTPVVQELLRSKRSSRRDTKCVQ